MASSINVPRVQGAHCEWLGTIISLERWLTPGIGWTGETWPAGIVTVNIWDAATHACMRTMWFDNDAAFHAAEPAYARLGLPPADYEHWQPFAWAPTMPPKVVH